MVTHVKGFNNDGEGKVEHFIEFISWTFIFQW
jgi:hypothetical protein